MPSSRELKQSDLGMWVLIASLGTFFAAGVLAVFTVAASTAIPLATLRRPLPPALITSTALLLVSSVILHLSLRQVRRERQASFRRLLTLGTALALTFFALQSQVLGDLAVSHLIDLGKVPSLHGLMLFMVIMHFLHAIFGVEVLAVVTLRCWRGRYDHEYYRGVKLATLYWDFLDVVWLTMVLSFYAAQA